MVGPSFEVSILDRDYADRQLIFVTTDLMAQAARDETINFENGLDTLKNKWKSAQQSLREKDWTGATAAVLNLYRRSSTMSGSWLGTAAAEAVRAWGRARESEVQILPVGKTAAKLITFPPGHPRNRVLYIGHPASPSIYYPMADFHRVTFEHKFCEVIEMLIKSWCHKDTGTSCNRVVQRLFCSAICPLRPSVGYGDNGGGQAFCQSQQPALTRLLWRGVTDQQSQRVSSGTPMSRHGSSCKRANEFWPERFFTERSV